MEQIGDGACMALGRLAWNYSLYKFHHNSDGRTCCSLRFFANEILVISIFTVPDCAQIDPSLAALLQDMCLN